MLKHDRHGTGCPGGNLILTRPNMTVHIRPVMYIAILGQPLL